MKTPSFFNVAGIKGRRNSPAHTWPLRLPVIHRDCVEEVIIMKMAAKMMCCIGLIVAFCSVAWATNSLMSPDDIVKMRTAKISSSIIELLVAEQTCSVTADFLVTLKNSGADDKVLEAVILADRYKRPAKVSLSVEHAEMLKKAGYSDDMILKLFVVPPARRVVDKQGNESVVYGTSGHAGDKTDTTPPSGGTFNINIEKVER